MRKPNIGDQVSVYLPHLDIAKVGTVDVLLSAQFGYEMEDGQRDLCLYSENWEFVGENKPALRRRLSRMDIYNAWVAYRREKLQGRGRVRVRLEGELVSWSDGIYHLSCPTMLTLVFPDGVEEDHALEI